MLRKTLDIPGDDHGDPGDVINAVDILDHKLRDVRDTLGEELQKGVRLRCTPEELMQRVGGGDASGT